MFDTTVLHSYSPAGSSPTHFDDIETLKNELEREKAEKMLLLLQKDFHEKYRSKEKYAQYANSLKKQLDEQKNAFDNQLNEQVLKHRRIYHRELIYRARLQKKWMNDCEKMKKEIAQKDFQIAQGNKKTDQMKSTFEQMQKTIEQKDFQIKKGNEEAEQKDFQIMQINKENYDLKQTVKCLQKSIHELENAYNDANELIEILKNQSTAKQNSESTPNVIMPEPILTEFFRVQLLTISKDIIQNELTLKLNKESSSKNNVKSESLKGESSCLTKSYECQDNKRKMHQTDRKNVLCNQTKRRNQNQVDKLKNGQGIQPSFQEINSVIKLNSLMDLNVQPPFE